MTTSPLLAGLLLGPLLASAQAAPPTPRFYVGLGATVLTARPFHPYDNTLLGPGLTVGWQLTPRLALQLGGAYHWEHRLFSNSYDDTRLGPVTNSTSITSKVFTLPLLLRATLSRPASAWRLDVLGGAQVQPASSSYTFTQTSPGRTEVEQQHHAGATVSLLLGPGVRYAVRPRLDVGLHALVNLNLQSRGYYSFDDRLSSYLAAGANFYFGR